MIKKIALILLLLCPKSYADHRPPTLAAAGLIVVLAGAILICEKFEKDGAFIGGILLAAAGISTIICSNDIVQHYDRPQGVQFRINF